MPENHSSWKEEISKQLAKSAENARRAQADQDATGHPILDELASHPRAAEILKHVEVPKEKPKN